MAENVNDEDDIEEEEEEEQGADAQQTLDDLTVLNEASGTLDDPDEQIAGDDGGEWEEPSASQSLSTIHTGSRPTDAELFANLIPEGEVIVEEGEIFRTQEEVGDPLEDIEPPEVELEADRELPPDPEPAPQPFAAAPADDEPQPTEAPVVEEEPEPEPEPDDFVAADAAPAAPVIDEILPEVTDAPETTEEPDTTDEPETLEVEDAQGSEDSAIPLDIDPGDATSVIISGVPSGATLSEGTDNGDGSWTVSSGDLEDLTITPPENSDEDFTLQVEAGGQTLDLNVNVAAVADDPTADAQDVTGAEDTAITLDLQALASQDTDGSETLSVTISGVPEGATFSAGTDNGDGTWTVDPADLTGLQITPPQDFVGDMDLTLTATSTEQDGGDFSSVDVPFTVTVTDTVDVATSVTTEDNAVSLAPTYDGDGNLTSGIELPEGVTSFDVSNIPSGATLSHGTDNGDGTWTVDAADLANLTIDPPADSSVDFTLSITADGVSQDLQVEVHAIADAPDITITSDEYIDGMPAFSGTAGAEIPLNLGTSLTDTDGSESLTGVTIGGVPSGAVLSAGTDNGDGTWTLSADDLTGLTITPAQDFDGNFNLTITSESTDIDPETGDSSIAESQSSFTVSVADAGTFGATDATGLEDTAIPLTIDPGNATEVTISGLPDGAVLSHGTDNGNGTFTVDAADLGLLTVTPDLNDDSDFTLTVQADGLTTELDVQVDADADAPTVEADDISGNEGEAIQLDLTSALTDTDGSETLSLTITIPEEAAGATLSHGTDNGDGTWTVDPADLAEITITPPADFFGDFDVAVAATSTEADGGDSETTYTTFNVSVTSDGTFGAVADASGVEDQGDVGVAGGIPLVIDPGNNDAVTIAGVPNGAEFLDSNGVQVGTDNGDGTWTLTAEEVQDLTIKPPAESDVDFDLTVSAEGETETATISVTVEAVADAPDAQAESVEGVEDTPILLDLEALASQDTDGSETLSVEISGVPTGATLSAGTDNGDGTWTVDPADIGDLTITPPTGFDGDIPLSMTVTTTETNGGDQASDSVDFTVRVTPDDEVPEFTVTAAEGLEDNAIPLDIDPGAAEVLVISDVPEGASLSAGTDNGDGSWTLAAEDLQGLTITPPENDDADFDLTVTAGGESESLHVEVLAVADRAELDVQSTVGLEDTRIPLDISSQLTDTDGSESLSLTIDITGIVDGATLTYLDENGDRVEITIDDNSASLTPEMTNGLEITPPQDFYGDINLQVTATTTEDIGGDRTAADIAVDTSQVTASFGVTVKPVEDNPILEVPAMTVGDEDTAIPLDIGVSMGDTTEEVASITIGNVPDGSAFLDSNGVAIGTDNQDGTWTFTAEEVQDISIQPPPDFHTEDIGAQLMTVTAVSTDGGIDVTGFTLVVEDTADLAVEDATGTEDMGISLDITAGLGDTTTISNIPDDATLTYVDGNGDTQSINVTNGSADLTTDQLNGLQITPPADSDDNFTLDVTNGEQALTLDVNVQADADAPTVIANDVSGSEDQVIDLDLSSALTDTDGSESLSVSLSGIPAGSTLTSGGVEITIDENGVANVDPSQLAGLQITPPADFTGSFDVTVTATATEADGGDTESTMMDFTVDVAGVADDPTLTVANAAGDEDTAIALNIDAGVTDADESLSVTISGVPSGASLSAGTDNLDGTWTLSSDDLDGLTITPPGDSDADFQLAVTATSTDGADTASVSGTIDVSVAADADAPTLVLDETAAGAEDTAIDLDITSALTDTDGSESLSITVGDIPDGSTLTYVDGSGDTQSITVTGGSAELTPDQLNGLQITPPDNFDGSFDLSVSATSEEGTGGDTATTTGSITVDVAAVADAADLTTTAASGTEDQAIDLDIDVASDDQVESISIGDIPAGSTLTYLDGNGDTQEITIDGTSADLTPEQLNGLQITPPADSDADFTLSVSATTVDGTDTATVTGTLDVSVAADADAPAVSVVDVEGLEDQAIALDLSSSLTDTDGSESLSVSLSGIPAGSTLSSGGVEITVDENGVANVDPAQLADLQITPPDDYSGSFDITMTATATEADGGDTAVTTDTFTVDVAGVADDPTLTMGTAAAGTEDQAIALNIDAGVTDASEDLSITISGVPSGATLSSGTDNGDGTWTLNSGQLENLTITPPDDSNDDFQLSVTATSTDGTDTAVSTGTIDVSVTGDADDASLSASVGDSTSDGTTTTVDLNVAAGLNDTDGSEDLSIAISGIPSGATLSSGSVEITVDENGVANVDPSQLAGLQITVPNDIGTDFDLSIAATTTEDDGDTATVTSTITIEDPDQSADGVDLDVSSVAAGIEDTAIALNIDASLVDTDGSETLSITIGGVPSGAVLSSGTDNGDGTWTVDPQSLDGLTITPPEDSNENFQLSVTATATESSSGDISTTTETLDVMVFGDADAPSFDISDSEGIEGDAIPLNIDIGLTDTDGSETLSITVSNIPDGAVLASDGQTITVENGAATLTESQLENLTIVPPDGSDGDFSLLVSATATEDDGDTNTVSGILEVTVIDDGADAPTLDLSNASGTEDNAIALSIDAALTDETETLSVTISGVPDGAILSSGGVAIQVDQNGVANVDPTQLAGLQITPPANSDDDFTLSVTATSTDGTETASVSGTLNVSVAPDADTPSLQISDASGTEDQPIDLSVAAGLTDTDGSETLSVSISGIPDGAVLSSGGQTITVDENGVADVDPALLANLQITPPANSDDDFTLTVSAMSTDGTDTATISGTIDVNVAADADTPTLTVADATGAEDTTIDLDITSQLTDTDGSETLSVSIADIPAGAVLTSGGQTITVDENGVAQVDPSQLAGLQITPPLDYSGNFDLTVTATSTETNGGDTASNTETLTLTVTVDEVDDTVEGSTLNVSDAAGVEDNAIALDIGVTQLDTDGSETVSISIDNIPNGAVLSSGGQEITIENGTATLSADQLENLTITPPADSDADMSLGVTVTTTETSTGETSTTSGTIAVDVSADADAPTLTMSDASGTEDQAIDLSVASGLTDTDGSETLSVSISGIPDGAVLTSGGQTITVDENGNADVDPSQLANLQITPPDDYSGSFDLTVSATSTEGDGGDTATTTGTISVDVAADADAPTLTVSDASGTEDQAIDLSVASELTDASEDLSVSISGIPDGATLSSGGVEITVDENGVADVDPSQLANLQITPPADSDGDFTLTVSATSTDGTDTATTTGTIDVSVAADADAPTLTVADASGTEDQAIDLSVASGLTDTDGSETLSVTISGIPDGAVLTSNGQEISCDENGIANIDPSQLANLQIMPPDDFSGTFDLTVTATSTEGDGGDTATTSGTITVDVAADADAPTLTVADASGTEDQAIDLSVASGLTDTDGSETLSVSISGIPDGATLSSGATEITVDENGVANVDPSLLDGLTITPPANSDDDFTLTVSATSTDGTDTATTTGTIDVSVAADADAPTLTVTDASGLEDTNIDLDITSALTDTDGSETLSVSISGIPDGAVLTSGGQTITVDQNGVADVDPALLADLQITPPAEYSGDFDLTVTSTSTEGDAGDTATSTGTLTVSVGEVDDDVEGSTLNVSDAAGVEDNAIALDIGVTQLDTDGSETVSISIDNIPNGAVLSSGGQEITIENGTATLSADQLENLTITPPADSDADMSLGVTVTTTETSTGETSTTSGTIAVDVSADADAPTLTMSDASGTEDQAIDLSVASGLTDTDGSETLSVSISGIPDGATLSSGATEITVDENGVADVDPSLLANLEITPPANSDADFTLTVSATSTEGDGGDTATTTGTIDVSVAADADAPTLTVSDASGTEDQAIGLNISSGLTDASETLSVSISGIPDGATLSSGATEITVDENGVANVDPALLDGLVITPPADSDDDFTLTVSATSQDGDDTATTTGTIDVSVAADADAPTLTLDTTAGGDEDTAIALDISTGLTDTDGSETLSVSISGIPDGAVLTSGGQSITVDENGVADVDPSLLADLQITPPDDFSGSFDLEVTATATEGDGGDTATTTGTISVDVDAVADDPTLNVSDASGTEDQAIDLSVAADVTDGSETVSVSISGIPDGATLSSGGVEITVDENGNADVDPAQLANLQITPPADSDGDFTLTVSATSTDGDDTATTTGTIDVSVAADADAPTLTVADASGTEDQPIDLSVASGLTDTDGSETLSVSISGIPDGAVLSSGATEITVDENGVASVDPSLLADLQITPPADSDADFTLTVSATSTDGDGGDTATTTGTIDVSVAADADAPTLTVADASGTEDQAIDLSVASGLTDTDGSETLSVSISGIPDGAVLTSGGQTITVDENGNADVDPSQLADLQITPPDDFSGTFDLSVTATSTEDDGGDTASTTGTITVDVAADADAPTLQVADASGTEDQAIGLNISSGLTDGSETLSVSISGIPDGATLSSGATEITVDENGVANVDPSLLDGLTITPPADSDADFQLSVSATSTDGTDTSTTTGTIDVSVAADADAPTLTLDTTAGGDEDTAIALDISTGLTDTDGSETLSVSISGIPDGAVLTSGGQSITVDENGVADVDPSLLADLQITPPDDFSGSFDLEVTATATEGDGGDTATTTGTISVDVDAVADDPTLNVSDASGTEDQAIDLSVAADVTDGSETLSVSISNIPDGAVLTSDGQTITVDENGVADVDPALLSSLQITPPADSDGDFQLTVSATSTDGDDTATTTGTIDVSVAADADAPTLTVADASGTEDQAIDLSVASGLTDTDGSETLSVSISGIPDGATLSSGATEITVDENGVADVDPSLLAGLTITPPDDYSGSFDLTVSATSTEGDGGDTATTSGTITVDVAADADAPTLTVADASGTEDQAIDLSVASELTDASEDLSVSISGIPDGATLSSGGVEITVDENGVADVDPSQLANLQITPPADSDGDFTLTVSATSTDGTDTATTTGTIDVSVAADADAPTLTVADASGLEDTAIGLDISSALTDTDGSETLSVTISGVPSGAELSAGTDNQDGTWTLEPGDLANLTVTPPQDFNGSFDLSVTATSTEGDGGDTATTTGTITIDVADVNDDTESEGATITAGDVSGTEDTVINLDIDVGLVDTDGSESVTSITISDVPTGASLSAGTDNGDGTWTLNSGDLDGLQLTPPADSNDDFSLEVSVVTTESSTGNTETTTATMDIDLTGDADTATLSASLGDDTAEVSGVTYEMDISAALADTDGSETLSVTISDVPNGVTLDAGTDNGNGTWTLEPGDLADLSMTVPDGTDAFDLTVTATSTEDDGDTATTTATISVEATDTSADEASLSTTDAAGNEDSAIALDIDASLTDTDGSESMSITIGGVPTGAELSAGTDNGDGTWTLEPGDLTNLTVTPPDDSNEDFSLSVSVTTTEASTGDTATTTSTIDVDVTGVADAPTLSVAVEHSGQTSAETDVDVPQAISDAASGDDSVVVSGVPDGAYLNAGTDNGDGTWTLDADQLDGLTVMPPEGSTDTISLSFDVPGTEEPGDTLVSEDFDSGVSGWSGDAEHAGSELRLEGDASTSKTFDFGPEHAGQTIVLSFDADAQNDWEESGSYQDYFNVSANGTEILNTSEESDTSYSFEVTLDQNGQVTIEMSTDTTASDERVDIDNFQIAAGDDWDSSLASADLDVTPEQGGTVYDVDLVDIQSSLTDTDGSETLSITVDGLPSGATLTAGTDNGDGTWSLTAEEVADLEMLVPAGSGDFDLVVSATATEDDGDTNTVTQTVTVVEPDTEADGATIDTTDATGNEDTAIALDIDVTQVDTDGSETMSITITDVPAGATLSAGTDNEDGTWTLTADDLDGLTVTPADDSNVDFTLGVSVTTTETSSGDTSTTTSTIDVDVTGVADAPTLSASAEFDSVESGETAVSVPQTISDAADTEGSSVTVSGVPSGASLSAGTDNGDGTWTLDSGDLSNLTVTPADGSTADISLEFDVTGADGAGDTLVTDNFDTVSGWGNDITEYNDAMEIEQDETASKTFDFGAEHAGQTVTVTFDSDTWGSWDESGSYADYFTVDANGTQVINTTDEGSNSHSFQVTLDENGQLTLEMNVDSTSSSEGVDIDNLVITAGDDWESSLASETVDVTPEPGGLVYDLDITTALTDTDGSESLSVTVADLPTGAELSAGTDNGDGTWTLAAGDLNDLQMTVPTDAGNFDLSVNATATENDGDTNTVSSSISISTPDVIAEEANLSTSDASGEEDRAIALDIDASLADTDGSETLSITISGVPSGAELSAGTDNGDGSWTLESGDLSDLTILPPTDSSDDFSLTVAATTTEAEGGATSTVTSTVDVTVAGVADAPELTVDLGDPTEVGGGATPVSYWNVDETSGLTLTDSVGNNDAESHGKSSSKDDLDLDDSGVFNTAAEFKSGDRQYMEVDHSPDLKPDEGALTMWFNADSVSGSDMFTLASSDSGGYDDGGHFGLFIDDGELRLRMQSDNDQTDFKGGSVDTGDWNQVTVTWGSDGAKIYLNGDLVASDDNWTDGLAGNENPWTFGANQWASSDDTANNLQDYFDGHMDDIAIYDEQLSADDIQSLYDDGVQDVMDSGGAESLQYPLDISANLADTDGSESLGITLEGLPGDAVLSAGTDNGDGTWTLDSGDLDGLTVTVPADADDFLLSVSATVTDEGGDTRTATEMVQVDVGSDGFDAGTVGTDSADTLTGSAGDDVISGEGGNDDIDAGDGADTVLGGAGDDNIDGGDGDDVIDGGDGSDTIEGGAGDDHVMGGQGDDLFIFGSGDGADYFQGGDGWSDTVQLDDVSGGPGGDSGWTLEVDEGVGYTQTENGIEFDAEASGIITLDDGSELTFDGVEKLEW